MLVDCVRLTFSVNSNISLVLISHRQNVSWELHKESKREFFLCCVLETRLKQNHNKKEEGNIPTPVAGGKESRGWRRWQKFITVCEVPKCFLGFYFSLLGSYGPLSSVVNLVCS